MVRTCLTANDTGLTDEQDGPNLLDRERRWTNERDHELSGKQKTRQKAFREMSTREEKVLKSSRDKNEGVIIPYWGGGRRARYVTPDLSYYWEGARGQCDDNKWGEETKKYIKKKGGGEGGGAYSKERAVCCEPTPSIADDSGKDRGVVLCFFLFSFWQIMFF